MKIAKKNKVKKPKIKNKTLVKPKKERVLIVAQEIKFATLLSGNEKKTRDRALKTLKKWLLNCFERDYEFKEGDFTRIWKGLFYAVWMSDKPLVQEELCESIAGILDLFPAKRLQQALLLTKVGFQVMATEWFGIDHHRMDKYLMLVRRYLRGSLRCLKRCSWRRSACDMYASMLCEDGGILSPKTPLYARNATSMILHLTDCFLEELAKVSNGDIPAESVGALVRPFCVYTCSGSVDTLCAAARRLLTALLKQTELGLSYRHKTIAWERMGCPEGGPDALELVSDDDGSGDDQGGDDDDQNDQDNADKPLDPRAGHVSVELASLPVPAAQIAGALKELLPTASSQQAQRRARICMQRFEALSRSQYPLPVMTPPSPPAAVTAPSPAAAAQALSTLEKKLASESDELALRGLSRKHRKRVLARRRAGESIIDDVTLTTQPSATNGEWQVEETEPQPKKKLQDTSNKENVNKNKKNKNKRESSDQSVDKEIAHQKDAIEKRKETKNIVNERQKEKQEFKKVKSKDSLENCVEKKLFDGPKIKNKSETSSQSVIKENNKKNQQQQMQQKIENNKNVNNTKKEKNNMKNKKEIITTAKSCENLSAKSKNMLKSSPKLSKNMEKISLTPKRVKFVLKNNSMQGPIDYYKSVRQSPSIPFDSKKKPSKTNLKPSTPSPINPFFKKKLKMKN